MITREDMRDGDRRMLERYQNIYLKVLFCRAEHILPIKNKEVQDQCVEAVEHTLRHCNQVLQGVNDFKGEIRENKFIGERKWQRCITVGKEEYHPRTQEEFEQMVKAEIDKIERSIAWNKKKRERESQRKEDKTPWLPKNLTQKEMNDWSVNNIDMIELVDSLFKDPCQEEQVLREMVILDRDHRRDLESYMRRRKKEWGIS